MFKVSNYYKNLTFLNIIKFMFLTNEKHIKTVVFLIKLEKFNFRFILK